MSHTHRSSSPQTWTHEQIARTALMSVSTCDATFTSASFGSVPSTFVRQPKFDIPSGKTSQDYLKAKSQPRMRDQLLEFRLLSYPMMKRDQHVMHERAEYIDAALGKAGNMCWSERQRKTLLMRRYVQTFTSTPDLAPARSSPMFCRMFDTFRAQDAYGVSVHLDQAAFHIFLVGTEKKIEYLRLPSCSITGHVRHLVRYLANAARGQTRQMSDQDTSRKMQLSTSPRPSNAHNGQDSLSHILSVLWEVLVQPIVRALQLQRSTSQRKRLIWCPTGLMNILPLHAAGIYEGATALQDNVANYAVSSYAPTFTAFCRGIDENSTLTTRRTRPSSVLILADQATSCAYDRLHHVTVEAGIIKSIVPPECIMDSTGVLKSEFASKVAPHVELLHFACHGTQDPSDPLLSGLEIRGGRLTLDELTKVNFPNGRLAYLSACETASFDLTCPDSGVNLATTFLFNGFRSVVGSMWSMQDIDGPFIAQRVYQRISRDGTIDYSAVPRALDEAVRELRETGAPASRWATFIHMGA